MKNVLLREKGWVNGEWIDSINGATTPIYNPATKMLLGEVASLGAQETQIAIDGAQLALVDWKKVPARRRANILHLWYQLIIKYQNELADILTQEQGKVLSEARGEIIYAANYVRWFAEEVLRINGEVLPGESTSQKVIVSKHPIGVVAAITPWNFPAAMITRKVAPALAAGCTCIVKPSPETPFTALALAELAAQAGLPAGCLNIVPGDAIDIGSTLMQSEVVRKLSFTGSTPVGKLLMAQAAQNVKRLSLELGGNAPFIVFSDADITKAVDAAMYGKFRNSGQTCVCINRFLVHESVHDKFTNLLKNKMQALKVGNGIITSSDMGPLINQQAVEKIKEHILDAIEKGGELLCGGDYFQQETLFFQPTLITNGHSDMLAFSEETFGPLAVIYPFSTEEEAINLANKTEYGLAAYCFTQSLATAWKMQEELEYGMVGINSTHISNEIEPFGGIKQSGFGREGSHHGINEYLEIKYTLFGD
ncbi:NAD-dependent succinate-semialdehyde dehydrogenase [Providencia sp. 21OH12SH02B-Prov]|uniref:NAD-dependent succinate-semialdehyde dehydrogenase n=1 Tax=Providencia sp. 21OH12SH02B-Prov TaxID=3015951 RepID=UPI0022B5F523|nr:NAD-dependent succinate-semialdehyde dehydrogenase [Providencia sp. 21OH12SH02B-Prov]WBA57720.1 NAD-dependent succinate-semialdehyde dehydrogenase [Providencia sp. 21OH12SH02B-Prov]